MAVANSGASLTNATTTGAGRSVTFTTVCKHHGAAVVVTNFADSGGATVTLEGSLDGTTWFTLPDGGTVRITGNGTYYRQAALPQPALFLRANLKVVLPAREIPPDCLCTWVACGDGITRGEMKLKFTNGHCAPESGSIPWDYRSWYWQPRDPARQAT